ncbi:MAG: hypothetical protein WD512_19150, partial [Candidatus Paceibacterota bacterium]
ISYDEVELFTFTSSIIPSNSKEFYDELWNILEDYCDCAPEPTDCSRLLEDGSARVLEDNELRLLEEDCSGGAGVWGSITGNIDDQLDLKEKIDSYLPIIVSTFLSDQSAQTNLVVAAIDRYYAPAFTTGTVKVFEASTGDLITTVSIGASIPNLVAYIASVGEIWVTNFNNTTIYRYNIDGVPLSPASFLGGGARATDYIEYSSTQVYLSNTLTSSVSSINPVTRVATTLNSAALGGTLPVGMVWIRKATSLHFGLIAVIFRSSNSIGLIDPATISVVATAVNPGSILSTPSYAAYSELADSYYVANTLTNNIAVLVPASPTTFAVVKTIQGISKPYGVVCNQATGLVYVAHGSASATAPVILSVIDSLTNKVIRLIPCIGQALSFANIYSLSLDSVNGFLYVVGYGNGVGTTITSKFKIAL